VGKKMLFFLSFEIGEREKDLHSLFTSKGGEEKRKK